MLSAEKALEQTNEVNLSKLSEIRLDTIKRLIDVAISAGHYSVVCHHSEMDADIKQVLVNLGYSVSVNNRISWHLN